MEIKDKNILWLDLFEFLTYHKKKEILSLFAPDEDIRQSFLDRSYDLHKLLQDLEFNKMASMLSDEMLDKVIQDYNRAGIITITINDDRYPFMLKEISTPPLCLYCKGNIQLLNSYCVGVVGTRKVSDYGLIVTKKYVKELVNNDVTIVSGMALGVDTIAHKSALEQEGKTIAVLAGGFNHIYPASNFNLSKQISQNNLLISENSPNILPLAYQFPIRNRIIAGLSHAVLVTEASEKSGSLITKDYALEYNRDVFAVPGKITSPSSTGTNMVIKELQASCTLDPSDMIDALGLQKKENQKNLFVQLDINAQIVLDYIQTEKKTFQQLVEHTKIPASELNIILTELEISNLITRLANNSFIKT